MINGQACATGNGGCNCDPKQCNPEVNKSHAPLTCSYPIGMFSRNPTAARVNAYTATFTVSGTNTTAANVVANKALLDTALQAACTASYTGSDCPSGYESGCSGLMSTKNGGAIRTACQQWIGTKNNADADAIKNGICANEQFKECDCINRAMNKDYAALANTIGTLIPDACWYNPCKGADMAAQLIDSSDQNPNCPNNVCEQIIAITNSTSVTLNNISQASGCKLPPPPPSDPVDEDMDMGVDEDEGEDQGQDMNSSSNDIKIPPAPQPPTSSMVDSPIPATLLAWIDDNLTIAGILLLALTALIGFLLLF